MAIVGLLVGLMIGRLTAPDPLVLEQVEVAQSGLDLWFNEEPVLHGENVEGTVALLFKAEGRIQRGEITLEDRPVRWRLQKSDQGLLLTLVAARPLQGAWTVAEDAGRWKVQVRLHE